MLRWLTVMIVVLAAAPAMAQEQVPALTTLLPVLSTDAARMANELTALMKAAQDAEGKAAYWKDACQSTVQCGPGAEITVGSAPNAFVPNPK